jgi:hypothetical protein
MILISDVDSVLADFMTPFRMYIWNKYRVAIREEDMTSFNGTGITYARVRELSPFPPKDFDEYDAVVSKATVWSPEFVRNLLPLEPLWNAMMDFPVQRIFLTTRHPSMKHITEGWLKQYGLLRSQSSDSFILRRDKWNFIEDIAKRHENQMILFYDDKLSTAVRVALLDLPNVRVRVPRRPWNDPTTSQTAKEVMVLETPRLAFAIRPDVDLVTELELWKGEP